MTESSIPLGREAECDRIAATVAHVAGGAKRGLTISGQAGIGKTALLTWAQAAAERSGWRTVLIRVPPVEGIQPAAWIREAIDALTRLAGVDPYDADDLAATPSVLRSLVERCAAGAPLGIFIDDFQSAPEAGANWLLAAARVAQARLLFACSVRSEAGDSPAPRSSSDLWFESLELDGLARTALGTFIERELGGAPMPSLVEAVYERTLGNPLFALELLRAWGAGGAIARVGRRWALPAGPPEDPPRSIQDLIVARVEALPPTQTSIVETLSLAGRPQAVRDLARMLRVEPGTLVREAAGLIAQNLVTEEGPPPMFRLAHPLFVAAIERSIPQSRRAALHGAILQGLRSAGGADAEQLARHAVAALEPPPDVLDLVSQAARAAAEAVDYGRAAKWFGLKALMAPDQDAADEARFAEGRAMVNVDPVRAVEILSGVLARSQGGDDRTEALWYRAAASRRTGRFDDAEADLLEAERTARPEKLTDVFLALGEMAAMQGRFEDAEAKFRVVASSEWAPARAAGLDDLGTLVFMRGHLSDAAGLYAQALELAEPDLRSNIVVNLAWLRALLGDWKDATTLYEEAIARADELADSWRLAAMLPGASRLASWLGDVPRAIDLAVRASHWTGLLGNPAGTIEALDALALAHLEDGKPSEARAALIPILQSLTPELERREPAFSLSILGEASARAGLLDEARAIVARAREELPASPAWAVALDRVDARIALEDAEPARALDLLDPWLEHPTEIAIERGAVLETRARALYASGDGRRALGVAEEAVSSYERLGAHLRADRVRRWVSSRTGRAGGRPRSTLPGGVTPRELDVLRLVVRGKPNKEIARELAISVGTAKKHVENLLSKAGAQRRSDLLQFAVRFGLTTTPPD